jgi:aminopeptidase N
MAGSNLTLTEAIERAGLLDIESYDIRLDLTNGAGLPGERTFRSRTEIRFRATPGSTTFLDLIADRILDCTLDGRPVDTSAYEPQQGLALSGLAAENVLVIEADCLYTNTGEGLHRFVDPVDNQVYLYSQFETADAKRVYACFDQPDLKATFTFHILAPQTWRVISNSPVTAVESVGTGGAQLTHFATTARMSTYVTAVVAGPYTGVTDSHDGIELGVYCRSSLVQYLDADNIFELTKQGFDWYHQQFGYRYPFGKYDQVFCPEFNAGAMENAGCVTILEDYIFRSKPVHYLVERRAETILHEMAHMWFGDLVTMRWWDDLWLNESFATFISFLCQSEAAPEFAASAWTSFENIEKSWGYRQDQLPSTHPIACDIPDVQAVEVNFDGITYAKGAAVLRQLMAYVGRDAFMAGMRTYFQRNAFGNATLSDLLAVLTESSGRDLATWAKKWLQTSQVNTIRPELELADDGTYRRVALRQEAPAEHPTLRPHRLAVGLYDLDGPRLALRRRIELDLDGELTEVAGLAGERVPDLLLVNDGGLAYTKIRLDDRSLTTAITQLAALEDPLARSLCWQAAWDMVRDAEMPARDYVRMVLRAMPSETTSSLVLDGLRNVKQSLAQYVDPAWAAEGWTALATTAAATAAATEPGSDAQLQWLRAFADAARSESETAKVRAVLDGTETVPGLEVDTDLRWYLVQALAATGSIGEAEIAAEVASDPTATGQRKATTARALLPNPAAKAEAWRLGAEDDSIPNTTMEAAILGFSHPTQLELTRPYLDRYFAELDAVWARRSSEVAQYMVLGLFPRLLVEQSTLEAADRWLAGNHSPALHRLVAEQRDGVRRALTVRARDLA